MLVYPIAQSQSPLQSPLFGLLVLLAVVAVGIILARAVMNRGRTRCGNCGKMMSGQFCRHCGAARPRRAIPLD